MHRMRKAVESDLPTIYKMQNVPIRQKLLITPLPPLHEYVTNATAEMRAGHQHFYLLESDSVATGLVWICVPQETCEIWGKHIYSLYYACARIAFEELEMERLNWWVRNGNQRMLDVCNRLLTRKTRSENVCTIGEKLEFVTIDEIHYFELTAAEYRERIELLRKYSLDAGNFFPDAADW